jgi:hypothetical protein
VIRDPLCKGEATPYIRDVKPATPAHRSRLCAEGAYRRPQEIHPEYIQIQTVGEAAPRYISVYSFTGKIEEIANMSFLICNLFQKIFDPNFSFLVWLYFWIWHFTNQNTNRHFLISQDITVYGCVTTRRTFPYKTVPSL